MSKCIRRAAGGLVLLAWLAVGAGGAGAQEVGSAVLVLSGDGLTVVVATHSEADGSVAGEIRRDGAAFPFTGQIRQVGGAEVVAGTFVAGGQSYPFETRQGDEDEHVTFVTGGRSYRLMPVDPNNAPAARPAPAEQAPPNPLAPAGDGPRDTARVEPLPGDRGDAHDAVRDDIRDGENNAARRPEPVNAPMPPNASRPPSAPMPADAPAVPRAADAARPAGGGLAGPGGTIKLKRVEFRDVSMGNVVSHDMLIPDGWTPDGFIEWSQGDTPYPQPKVRVTSPDGARVSFVPAMTFNYFEMKPMAGIANPGPQGTPAPAAIGEWLASFIAQSNKKVRNVRLVSDVRDPKAEAAAAKASADMGANVQGVTSQTHVVTIAYEQDGRPFRDEIGLTYSRFDPYENENLRSEMWSLFVNTILTAPEQSFDALRPELVAIAGTFTPRPKWWNQVQLTLMQLTRVRAEQRADAIKRRAQAYDEMSDAQAAAFKKKMAGGDREQNERLNTIAEVDDYKDTDGNSVKLPFHYHHAYSDGKGNYVLSNTTLDRPGDFTEIKPAP